MSKQYRSELRILKEVLGSITEHGRSGALMSTVARNTNLSYYGAIEKCKKLADAGLITLRDDTKMRFMVATETGLQFLHQVQIFTLLIEGLNLRF